MSLKQIAAACILFILASCNSGPKTIYNWNSYENTIYKYNKNDLTIGELQKKLSEVVTKSESDGRVPPGLYAEYGYVLSESGKFDEAIQYFKKESEMWPESRQFMGKIIKRVELQKKQKSGK